VRLPADSVDGLAQAIKRAGPHGTVIVERGVHVETSTVVVKTSTSIIGEPGAIIESAATTPDADFPIVIEATLHLKTACGATVKGIWFRPPAGQTGSCAVLVEHSPGARIVGNRVTEFQFGVVVQRSDHVTVRGNHIAVSTAWTLEPDDPDFLSESDGIIVINGRHARVTDNVVSGGFDGIWMCDKFGVAARNSVSGNYIGLLLCRVAADTFTISSQDAEADDPGTSWQVHDNVAHGNDWGIQVTDGAHKNVLVNNDATGNHVYEVELTGDTDRYGYFVPRSFKNVVLHDLPDPLVVKDCGDNNIFAGNVTLVDTVADPCF
jgi:parallel beta-helix repeat protein